MSTYSGNDETHVVLRGSTFFRRKKPYTYKNPTVAQKEIREKVSALARIAAMLTDEEVAELVKGTVVGKNVILYKGQLLPRQTALIKFFLEGYESNFSKKEELPSFSSTEELLKFLDVSAKKVPMWMKRLAISLSV